MGMSWCVRFVGLLVLLGPALNVSAEIFPPSEEVLRSRAHAIVVGEIEQIRIESEPSRIERAFGNYDWGIYLTLKVESVEQGEVPSDTIEVRTFRIKSRTSLGEYVSISGHHPIPGVGSRITAYLTRDGNSWEAIVPNGLSPLDKLPDAQEVTQLWSLPYTFLLPLEGWLVVLVVGLPVMIYVRRARQRRQKSSIPEEAETLHRVGT